MHKRLLALSILLLLVLAAACAAPVPSEQAVIDMAVQATLTAVVADGSAPPATPAPPAPANNADETPQATATPRDLAAASAIVLPPQVPGFDPAPRPAKTIGDPNAPVIMYEWSDYTCPYCRRFHSEVLPLLEEAYVDTGKLQIVYKEYPVVNGDLSVVASLASECAAQQDGFSLMHDWLFENVDAWANQNALEALTAASAELGLDSETFNTCMQDQASIEPIVVDYEEGQAYNVRGTPNFIVNGHLLQGLLPAQQFMDIIDALIVQAETGALPDAVVTVTPSPTPDTDFEPETNAPRGDPDAPIVIVEFSDYQCPYCLSHFTENMPQLLQDYIDTGKVQYIFKDFPLSQIHPQAQMAAEAAECAGVQEKYWEMHDLLFAEQAQWSNNSGAADVFKQFAAQLELDADAFAACLDSGEFRAEVEADLFEGINAGVTGTPAFFVNGRFLNGFRPYEDFSQLIEQLLAEN